MRAFPIALLLLSSSLLTGCPGSPAPTATSLPAEVTLDSGNLPAGVGLLGGWTLDLDGLTPTLTPLRATTLGESFTVSGAAFFNGPLCSDCLRATGVRREAGQVVVTFAVKHPYPAGNLANPPSGQNRLDLDVFDAALVLDPTAASTATFGGINRGARTGSIVESDGLTRELAAVLGEPAALPYVLVVDDSTGSGSTFNRLAMGGSATCEVRFDLAPEASESLALYLTMGYGASATRPTRLTPTYFNPEFNRKSAWKVAIASPPPIEGQTWAAGDPTPRLLEVRAWDWQIGATVDPALVNPTDIAAASGVASVSLELPGVSTDVLITTTPASGTGAPADPLVYLFNVPNDALAGAGEYVGLVQVLDERVPPASPSGAATDALVHATEALQLTWHEQPEFATYQLFTATVTEPTAPPTVGPVEGCELIVPNRAYTFTTTATGGGLMYHWDNGQNTPGVYDDATTAIDQVDFTYTTGGTFVVGVEVMNGAGSVASLAPLTVRVLPGPVFVDADNSGDPMENGSWDHPYDTLPEGLGAVTSGGTVCLEPAATAYPPFAVLSDRAVVGFDRTCGNDRPQVAITNSQTLAAGASNVGIERIIFELNLPSGGAAEILLCDTVTNLTLRDCRFTGTSARTDTTILTLQNVDDSIVQGNEWVNLEFTGTPGPSGRNQYMLRVREGIGVSAARLSSNIQIKQNEFHDLGYPGTGNDAGFASRLKAILLNGSHFDGGTGMTFGQADLALTNNLFYNFYDNSTGATNNADHNDLEVLFLGGLEDFTLANNTMDNFDVYGGNPSQAGAMKGCYGGGWTTAPLALKNNIWKSAIWYQGPLIFHWSAGFWKDGDGPYPMSNSCVYWGNPAPACGPCQVSDYLNRISEGPSSYGMTDLVDPDFDYTPGPTYYHPQNPLVATGGDDGGEMGAFGGPEGDFLPPSQRFP